MAGERKRVCDDFEAEISPLYAPLRSQRARENLSGCRDLRSLENYLHGYLAERAAEDYLVGRRSNPEGRSISNDLCWGDEWI